MGTRLLVVVDVMRSVCVRLAKCRFNFARVNPDGGASV